MNRYFLSHKRILLIAALFVLAVAGLLLRLGYLQLIASEELTGRGDLQKVRTVELTQAQRGAILDCSGVALTGSGETTALLVIPALLTNPDATVSALCNLLALDRKLLTAKIYSVDENGEELRFVPFIAATGLNKEQASSIAQLEESGLYTVTQGARYRNDLPALHLIGTIGANESGSGEGLSGLEYIYNDVLRGEGGRRIGFVVDNHNRALYDSSYLLLAEQGTGQEPGTVTTTLDLELQRAAESALGEAEGAAVVLAVDSGDVLALASSPKFDPTYLTQPVTDDVYVNKALAPHAAASLFKIFLGAAALERNVVTMDEVFTCTGGYALENGSYVQCWKKEGHGTFSFKDALAYSCNPVFIELAKRLGKDVLESSFHLWELDADNLIGYPLGTRSGMIIDGDSEAALANIALGEQGVELTVLNAAKLVSVIAAGGVLHSPRLVSRVEKGNGDVTVYGEALPKRVISVSTAAQVTAMLCRTATQGTAASLELSALDVAVKTGTSETGSVWVGGFLPASDPRYVVVVMIENGRSGVVDAGPAFKKICAYLSSGNP